MRQERSPKRYIKATTMERAILFGRVVLSLLRAGASWLRLQQRRQRLLPQSDWSPRRSHSASAAVRGIDRHLGRAALYRSLGVDGCQIQMQFQLQMT